ncbi:MAG: nucleotidyltransferase domain-containing protein [Nitrospirota bacterium]
MKKVKIHRLSEGAKKTLTKKIAAMLSEHKEILFAYLHGSFLKENSFHDIDIAVYLKKVPSSPLTYELEMEKKLSDAADNHEVEVRILNISPLSFRYNVIKDGLVLFDRDDNKRCDFQEATISSYFDFEPYRKLYLKETLFGV